MSAAVRTVTAADGVEVAIHDLGGEGPPMVLAHAAGFHGLVLAPLAGHLASDVRCVAVDERGHGDTRLPAGRDFDWHGLAADVLAAVDGLGLRRPYGFGHSSGGTAVLMAELARPGTFAGCYVFEPVLIDADPTLGRDLGNWLATGARRRRDVFADREEAYGHYAARPPLASLDPHALRAYVDHGFEDDGAGGVRLKCRPEVEATVYETATDHDTFPRLSEVRCPVLVACGSESDAFRPEVAADVARRMPAGRSEVVPGVGHFGPLERPDVVAGSVQAFVGGVAGRSDGP